MKARIVALAAALWRARASDEAALAASVSTDASGLFTLGYYWYGILRQPSFHEEFEKCYDALDLDAEAHRHWGRGAGPGRTRRAANPI